MERITRGFQGVFTRRFAFLKQLTQSRGIYQFSGQCSQRPVLITYSYRWRRFWNIQTCRPEDERLEIQFPLIQKFWLRMILEPGRPMGPDEVSLDHPELDRLYIIHSNQTQAAREFLTSQAALLDLQRLPYPFDRLEIHKGWGKTEFHFPARRKFDRLQLQIAIESLARIFSEYETLSKLVIIVTGSQDHRCPYCRENLAAGNVPIVQCVHCNAKVHAGCWNENKQCTTWGCQSTAMKS